MKIIKRKKGNFKKFLLNFFNIFKIIYSSSSSNFIIQLICNIGIGIFLIVSLLLWKNFISSVISSLESKQIIPLLIQLLMLFFIKALMNSCQMITEYYQQIQPDYIKKHILNIVIDNLSSIKKSVTNLNDTEDLIKKMVQDNINLCIKTNSTIISIFKNTIILIGTTMILASNNLTTMTLFMIFMTSLLIINVKISRKKNYTSPEPLESLKYSETLMDLIIHNNNNELKLFNAIPFLKKTINISYEKHLDRSKKSHRDNSFRQANTCVSLSIMSYCLHFYTVITAIQVKATIDTIFMYMKTIDCLEYAANSIIKTFILFQYENLSIDTLIGATSLSNEEDEGTLNFTGTFNTIIFNNVSFKYPYSADYSLSNISLCIKRNKTYGIAGEHGSGKTTLVKLLMRIYEPTEGEILVDGINLKQYTHASIHKKISTIFQDYIRYPMDVQSNIGIGNVYDIYNEKKIRRAAVKSKADEFITQLPNKYKTPLLKKANDGIKLTNHQWQKIAISRAYVNESACILIMDEPAPTIDPKTEFELFENFKNVTQNQTSIIISHHFTNVKLADEIFVMQTGKLIEHGSHEQLMANGNLYLQSFKNQSTS